MVGRIRLLGWVAALALLPAMLQAQSKDSLRQQVHSRVLEYMKSQQVGGATGESAKYSGKNLLGAYRSVDATHTALAACLDWNATRIEDVGPRGVLVQPGRGMGLNQTKRYAVQHCRERAAKGCECTLVEVDRKLVLELPDDFVKRMAGVRLAAPPAAKQRATAGDVRSTSGELRYGEIAIQKLLLALGYSPGRQDGVTDAATQKAIRNFQRENGYPVTGRPSGQLLVDLADTTLRRRGQ